LVVSELHLYRFRNLQQHTFVFSPGKNLIHGVNGAGKTSVLEAIYLCAFAKSFLNARRDELATFGNTSFQVLARIQTRDVSNTIRAEYSQRMAVWLNDKKTTLAELSSVLYPIFFSSQDYWSYIDSTMHLRRLVDRFIFGVRSLYIHYILRYNLSLRNKAFLLKNHASAKELGSWNKVMAETGYTIYQERKRFVRSINETLAAIFPDPPELRFTSILDHPEHDSVDGFFACLQRMADREKLSRRCLVGVHKDEYALYFQNKNVRVFSSGEKKRLLMMLFLAYVNHYHQDKKEYPVFLIDDYDAAIDDQNVQRLLDYYPEIQVIATSVRPNPRFDQAIALTKEN
jgi:DNA replication and repair protein RecF